MLHYVKLVKFQHTIFALPFALTGFFLAYAEEGLSFLSANSEILSPYLLLGLVILCMVFARNAAMGFNRYADRDIDAANPRTKDREIPAGKISPAAALTFVIINCIAFIITTYFINDLCFYLSIPALIIVLGYSLVKRFSSLCHMVLGLALAIAPTAAYISVTGSFITNAGLVNWAPIILSLVVLLWTAGFDILYSLSDEDFDKSKGLHSIPERFGRKGAFGISVGLHLCIIPLLVLFYFVAGMSWLYIIGAGIFTLLLIYQHVIVSPTDLRRLNAAFFTSNGIASILFSIFCVLDLLLK